MPFLYWKNCDLLGIEKRLLSAAGFGLRKQFAKRINYRTDSVLIAFLIVGF